MIIIKRFVLISVFVGVWFLLFLIPVWFNNYLSLIYYFPFILCVCSFSSIQSILSIFHCRADLVLICSFYLFLQLCYFSGCVGLILPLLSFRIWNIPFQAHLISRVSTENQQLFLWDFTLISFLSSIYLVFQLWSDGGSFFAILSTWCSWGPLVFGWTSLLLDLGIFFCAFIESIFYSFHTIFLWS